MPELICSYNWQLIFKVQHLMKAPTGTSRWQQSMRSLQCFVGLATVSCKCFWFRFSEGRRFCVTWVISFFQMQCGNVLTEAEWMNLICLLRLSLRTTIQYSATCDIFITLLTRNDPSCLLWPVKLSYHQVTFGWEEEKPAWVKFSSFCPVTYMHKNAHVADPATRAILWWGCHYSTISREKSCLLLY